MKAINLIADGNGRGGGSSNAGFALLGVLAVLVAGVTYYVLTANTLTSRRAELTTLTTQAAAAQTQADRVRPYVDFASLASVRVQTVRQLGAARFDWRRAFTGLSRVLPDNVWLTSLLGTVAPGVTVEGAASGATGTLRSSLPNPAIELTGCTTTHDNVVRLLSRLRLMEGVVRVSLADSTKGDTSNDSSSSAGASDSGDCRHGHESFPQFDLVVFFTPLPALPSAPSTGADATAGATGAPTAATGTAQPAATTTPAATGAPSTGSAAR